MTAIVILHYMNVNVTTKCLSCLRKSPEFSTLRVIIVDNGSPNDSGEVLREMYTSIPNITVIRNAENLGFSAGNNVGYRVARERFHADQILVINSDLYIQDLHFFKDLDALTKANPEDAILAPDVLNAAGEHQNPHKLKISKSYPFCTKYLEIVCSFCAVQSPKWDNGFSSTENNRKIRNGRWNSGGLFHMVHA